MTLIEVSTITAVSTLIFALVLAALISTNREANDALLFQVMRQEALLSAHRLERLVRHRMPSGARPDAPAAPAGLPSGDVRIARDPEKFTPDELTLVVTELAEGEDRKPELRALAASIRNGGGVGETASHAYIQTRDLQGNAAISRRDLSSQSDRYQSSISFRYATDATTSSAVWMGSTNEVPRLIEYTIRLWPNRPQFRNFEDARDPQSGRPLGFEYISAVRLP
jgi:hypothetical protein